MPAPKDPVRANPALSGNYRAVWLGAEEPQAAILPYCVTLELWGKKTRFTYEIGGR